MTHGTQWAVVSHPEHDREGSVGWDTMNVDVSSEPPGIWPGIDWVVEAGTGQQLGRRPTRALFRSASTDELHDRRSGHRATHRTADRLTSILPSVGSRGAATRTIDIIAILKTHVPDRWLV